MATWIDFKELRSKLKIADVLAMYKVTLKVKGDRATAFCPLPGHKSSGEGRQHTPSFSVHLGKNIFQCFSCSGKGNVLDFACLMDGGNPDDPASIRKTALRLQETMLRHSIPSLETEKTPDSDDAKTEKEDAIPAGPVVVNAPLDFELKHLDPTHPYSLSRGFTAGTIEHFGLGFCSKGMMAERIAIPLHDAAGKLIGYAGRLVDNDKVSDENPKYRFPGTRAKKGVTYAFRKSEFLYNGHRIDKPADDLIVVEGFASVWWLWQHGYGEVVALMGASISPSQAARLNDLIAPPGRVWIFTDGDLAGDRCAQDVFSRVALNRSVRWARLQDRQPTDCSADELSALLPFQ